MTCTKRSLEAFVLFSALATSASAFGGVAVPSTSIKASTTALPALIFGWDGQEETTDTATSTVSYTDIGNDIGQSCSPLGTAVAESLSYDRERAGHLARLAVAFSPPERALTLDVIENVDVICVHDDSIEIQAILCEEGGCVSLSVPIQFPKACFSLDQANHLEGCVLQNLDELDSTAGATLMMNEQKVSVESNLDELCELNEQFLAYPDWWIPPECNAYLAQDCENVRFLLNEDEFQADVRALAQDALRKLAAGEDYRVLQAKVAIVGPAGICFKVRAENEFAYGKPVHILEVVHPFDNTMQDVESLRAAVLGAVAAAEGI